MSAVRTLDDIYTPMSKWGQDHWTTLAYIETRIVDHLGVIKDANMRNKHPQYPTRLNDGTVIEMHSDWDCLDDMIFAGVVKGDFTGYSLTDYGWEVAGGLRRHIATTRKARTYVPPVKP